MYGPSDQNDWDTAVYPGIANAIASARSSNTSESWKFVQHEVYRVARAVTQASAILSGHLTWQDSNHPYSLKKRERDWNHQYFILYSEDTNIAIFLYINLVITIAILWTTGWLTFGCCLSLLRKCSLQTRWQPAHDDVLKDISFQLITRLISRSNSIKTQALLILQSNHEPKNCLQFFFAKKNCFTKFERGPLRATLYPQQLQDLGCTLSIPRRSLRPNVFFLSFSLSKS